MTTKIRVFHPDEFKIYYFNSFYEIVKFQGIDYGLDQYRLEKDGAVTFMCFTGMRDKYGKDIYEGDLLKYENRIGEVRYDYDRACFKMYSHYDFHEMLIPFSVEVIGNIYTDKELMPLPIK